MAQIRNYQKGVYETKPLAKIAQVTDSTNTFLQFDGILTNAFSNLVLYADAGGASPLPLTSYASTTTDDTATALEAETSTGGSGYTVYSQLEVSDATYQNVDLYATFTNFGTYTDNDAAFNQIGGSDTVTSSATLTAPLGNIRYRFNFDTTLGDIVPTIEDGQFDGQQIILKETGSGNKARIKGNGFYLGSDGGGMYLVGRSILCTWNDNDNLWEMDDSITAQWTDVSKITTFAKGRMVQRVTKSIGAATTHTFDIPFLTNDYAVSALPQTGAGTRRGCGYTLNTTTNIQMQNFNIDNTTGVTNNHNLSFDGTY